MGRLVLGLFLFAFAAASARADQVKYLPHPDSALAQYIADIRSAQTSIDLTYYIWDPCSVVARILVRELERKKKENSSIPIRLVLDASLHSDKGRSEITATLAKRGIEVRFFNYMGGIGKNLRTHVKLMTVDGRRTISGGRNIADDYYSLSPNMNWIDREARVEGPASRRAVTGFNQLWNNGLTKPEPRKASAAEVKASEEQCLKADQKVLETEKYLNDHLAELLARDPVHSCPDTKITVDRADFMDALNEGEMDRQAAFLSGERLMRKETTNEIANLLKNARRSAILENYTYIPVAAVHSELTRLRDQGRPITVFTNDPHDEDQGLMRAPAVFYQNQHNAGTQRIVQVPKGTMATDAWAMTPKTTPFQIHAKVFTTDDKNAVVGSFNLDPRSFHTNLESSIVVKNCPAFAAHVNQVTQETYRRASAVLRHPSVKNCLESRPSPNTPIQDFMGWAVHEFL